MQGRPSTIIANKLVNTIIKRAESLVKFPHIGRVVPEFCSEDLREIIEGNYRIIYICQKNIVIITVFERHRLFPEEDLLS